MSATKHFIEGDWREGAGPTMQDINPTTGKPITDMAIATEQEVDAAVRSARRRTSARSANPATAMPAPDAASQS